MPTRRIKTGEGVDRSVVIPANYRKPTSPRDPFINKGFIAKIADAINAPSISSFNAFPKETYFSGQDRGEEIVLIIRQHPIILFPSVVVALLLLLGSFVVASVLANYGLLGSKSISGAVAFLVLVTLVILTSVFSTFLRWFYTLNIVTTKRIVDLDFHDVIKHVFTEARLERVEDISHKPMGLWSSIFDFGDVFVQTAGTRMNIIMNSVPRARDIQDTIYDLIDMKHRGEI